MHPVPHRQFPAFYPVHAILQFHFFKIIVLLHSIATLRRKVKQLSPFIFGEIPVTVRGFYFIV